jgi:hypothetical protein
MILPLDVTRCINKDCKESLNCKRYLASLEDEGKDVIWYTIFDEINCEFKIEIDEHRT